MLYHFSVTSFYFTVEIKNTPNKEQTETNYSALSTYEVSYHHLHLAETQRQCGEWKSLEWKKKGALGHALIGGCWNAEAGGKVSGVTVEGHLA